MLKNTAGQKWRVFAFVRSTGVPSTGDGPNITAKLSKDFSASLVATTTTNPTEIEDGYYYFPITLEETAYDQLEIFPESSTPGIQVIGVPGYHALISPPAEPATVYDDLQTYAEALGPQRVKTKEVEVEAHDPLRLQKLLERQKASKPITLSNFPRTNVLPKTSYSICVEPEDLD